MTGVIVSSEVPLLGISIQWLIHGHWALIRSWLPLFPVGESVQRYLIGGEHRRQPVLSILSHASMALCRSIRRRVWGTGGRGETQL